MDCQRYSNTYLCQQGHHIFRTGKASEKTEEGQSLKHLHLRGLQEPECRGPIPGAHQSHHLCVWAAGDNQGQLCPSSRRTLVLVNGVQSVLQMAFLPFLYLFPLREAHFHG